MRELRCDAYLTIESLWCDNGSQLGPKYFDRNRSRVLSILCEVDDGHSSAADFALDTIAIPESFLDRADRVRRVVARVTSVYIVTLHVPLPVSRVASLYAHSRVAASKAGSRQLVADSSSSR